MRIPFKNDMKPFDTAIDNQNYPDEELEASRMDAGVPVYMAGESGNSVFVNTS